MLFFYPKSSLPDLDEAVDSFFRGIGFSGSHTYVGTSQGQLISFTSAQSTGAKTTSFDCSDLKLDAVLPLSGANSPVSAVAASSSVVAYGFDSGSIIFLDPNKGHSVMFKNSTSLSPCTSMIAKNDVVIAGFSTGHIRIFRCNICELAVEIRAHARPVSGLAFSPRSAYFASCGEDQIVNVWDLPDFSSRASSSVSNIQSIKLQNQYLTGVAFISHNKIGVASYDDDFITILTAI
jgi:WD40 repeat protein